MSKCQKCKNGEWDGSNAEHSTRQQSVYRLVQSTQEVQQLVQAAVET